MGAVRSLSSGRASRAVRSDGVDEAAKGVGERAQWCKAPREMTRMDGWWVLGSSRRRLDRRGCRAWDAGQGEGVVGVGAAAEAAEAAAAAEEGGEPVGGKAGVGQPR